MKGDVDAEVMSILQNCFFGKLSVVKKCPRGPLEKGDMTGQELEG